MLQMRLHLIPVFLMLLSPSAALSIDCAAKNTEALHSPECGFGYVVSDPNRVQDIKIAHDPPYHTYSAWRVGNRAFVLAYFDQSKDPTDVVADIYERKKGRALKLGSVPVFSKVANVEGLYEPKIGFTGFAIFSASGQLQMLRVVSLGTRRSKVVFDDGASAVKVLKNAPLTIEVSGPSSGVRVFEWDRRKMRFKRKQ